MPGKRAADLYAREVFTRETRHVTEWRRPLSRDRVAELREAFLGRDHVKVDAGKWRSIDGRRQLRLKPNDYLGRHSIGGSDKGSRPHVHLEFLRLRPGGRGFVVTRNVHRPLVD